MKERTRRKYSDREKAHALAVLYANRGNVLKTARELNMPERTLHDWSHLVESSMNPNSKRPVSPEYGLEIVQLRNGKEAELSDLFEDVARKYLARAGEDAVVAETRGRDAVFSAAIATDKTQLLRGLPTGITASVMSEEDRMARLAELVETIRARHSQTIAGELS